MMSKKGEKNNQNECPKVEQKLEKDEIHINFIIEHQQIDKNTWGPL
jgi:hypothetical protein